MAKKRKRKSATKKTVGNAAKKRKPSEEHASKGAAPSVKKKNTQLRPARDALGLRPNAPPISKVVLTVVGASLRVADADIDDKNLPMRQKEAHTWKGQSTRVVNDRFTVTYGVKGIKDDTITFTTSVDGKSKEDKGKLRGQEDTFPFTYSRGDLK